MSNIQPKTKMLYQLMRLLDQVLVNKISDVHLRVGHVPVIRQLGRMIPTNLPKLTEPDLFDFVQSVAPYTVTDQLDEHAQEIDFSFLVKDSVRFRANLFFTDSQPALVLRAIPLTVPAFASLGVPKAIEAFCTAPKGLFLVTGPTGSGKTTTLASLLDAINQTQYKHIVTVEDPIEFMFTSKKSLVTQREIGHDTASFAAGIRSSLRQDPDVILIGEIRDRDTMIEAMRASETGHLVFSTLHTHGVAETLDRIVNFFEPKERPFMQKQLARTLLGTLSQHLVRSADEKSRALICEYMTVTPGAIDYIERGEMLELERMLDTGDQVQMQSMNRSLLQALQQNLISEDDAFAVTTKPNELNQMLRGAFHRLS